MSRWQAGHENLNSLIGFPICRISKPIALKRLIQVTFRIAWQTKRRRRNPPATPAVAALWRRETNLSVLSRFAGFAASGAAARRLFIAEGNGGDFRIDDFGFSESHLMASDHLGHQGSHGGEFGRLIPLNVFLNLPAAAVCHLVVLGQRICRDALLQAVQNQFGKFIIAAQVFE